MAYYERKHPSIQENELDLTTEDRTKLQLLKTTLGPSFDDVTDATLFRFLRFNGLDVQRAAQAFRDYVQWRRDENVDNILDVPVEKQELFEKLIPYAYHGYDKEGRPLYMEKTGKIVTAGLAQGLCTVQELLRSHVWGFENLMKRAFDQSLKLGRRIDQFTIITDLDGLGFGHKDAIGLLKACTELDNKYYPEKIARLYLLNLPWIAPMLWGFLQPFIDDVTKSKLHVVDGDPKNFLPSVIPIENLPVEYGGTCTCPQNHGLGCIPQYNVDDLLATLRPQNIEGLDKANISYDFETSLSSGNKVGVFTWYFESEGGYDIDFSIDGEIDGDPFVVKEISRCVTSKGSYEAKPNTKLTFRWDNNFSYFYSKNIKYAVSFIVKDVNASYDMKSNPSDQSAADLEKLKLDK